MEAKKIITFITAGIMLLSFSVGGVLAEEINGAEEYTLQQSDVLIITVHEHPDLETRTRVTADGYITFPLLGKVEAEGVSVQELEKNLRESLEEDYLVNAQVLVFIEEYHARQVSVIGEVNTPGKYDMPYEKDITVLEVIAMAEGFTEDADINNTKVIREEDGEKVNIKIRVKDITNKGQKEKDIVLKPNDIVFVPESFF